MRVTRHRVKQLVKNAVYRSIGEVSSVWRRDPDGTVTLRVLMYHRINDVPDNPMSVPVRVFDEQLAVARELGYEIVDLGAVLDHYVNATPLPANALLITFDDGYRDIYDNALPVLRKHGAPAVAFVPVAYIGANVPLPHDTHLIARGIRNPVLDWGLVRALDDGGIRVESHGLAHTPLASVPLDTAVREIAASKLELEDRLGRPVRAYAYVKGSEAYFHAVHERLVEQAGYDVAFTTVSRGNGPATNPFRLGRYNVEPYSARTFELVLTGACDMIAAKDTVAGTHARRLFNRVLGTATR